MAWGIALKKSPAELPNAELAFGLFQREQRSLFGEILDWMLTPLLLLWPLSLALTWWVAQGIAAKPYDRALEYNLRVIAPLVKFDQQTVRFNLTREAQGLMRTDDADLIFYQVLGAQGAAIAGEKDFPIPAGNVAPRVGIPQLRDDQIRGEDVRVAYMWVQAETGSGPLALLQVAETLEKRSTLATEIIKGVMVPQFVILPLAVLLVWLALVRGIRPLNRLEQRIRQRRPNDLSPLDDSYVPQEVAPLVQSINDLLERLTASLTTQRRFLADAAHQLKTPLAGLRMQADLAQRERDPKEVLQALAQIARSSVRATHTVNQLLALAKAESTGRTLVTLQLDLAHTVIEVLQDCVPRAMEKNLDIGFEGPESVPAECLMEGNATLLRELVRNLVDNAIAYTPAQGVVTVRLLVDRFSGVQVLQVEDSGPGIPPEERALVLQPFYRTLGTNVDGSGLGLAIVQEIAQQCGATLEMSEAHTHKATPGLLVTVRFPPSSKAAEDTSNA